MNFKHVFRKDVYESDTSTPIYIIVEGVDESQKIKIEYRDGKEIPKNEAQSIVEEWKSQHSNEAVTILKALINGLPEEYDDLHTKNLIEKAQSFIAKNA